MNRSHDLVPLARLAPALGTLLILIGVWMAEAWWFWALAPLAVAGALLGGHPLDLAYNEVLAPILGTRPIARCGTPRRYALAVATVWLIVTGFAFANGPSLAGGILAGLMGAATFMTAALDVCLPCAVFTTRRRVPQSVPMEDEPTALFRGSRAHREIPGHDAERSAPE